MKSATVQKQRRDEKASLEEIAKDLDMVANLLAKVLGEIKYVETGQGGIRLSAKAQRSLDRGLRDLKQGKYTVYKDFNSFKRSFG